MREMERRRHSREVRERERERERGREGEREKEREGGGRERELKEAPRYHDKNLRNVDTDLKRKTTPKQGKISYDQTLQLMHTLSILCNMYMENISFCNKKIIDIVTTKTGTIDRKKNNQTPSAPNVLRKCRAACDGAVSSRRISALRSRASRETAREKSLSNFTAGLSQRSTHMQK